MEKIMRVGLDLAKSVFVVYGVDEREQCRLRRTLRRAELLQFFATLEPCLVGMESGSGAHYWARELQALGHDARIMDPRLVVPYRNEGRTGKNDSNDAAAICEAVGRPRMRFVPIKNPDQQAVLLVHRVRKALVSEQNRVANQLRGLLAEFGVVLPKGLLSLKRLWPGMRQTEAERIPGLAWEELDTLARPHHQTRRRLSTHTARARRSLRAQVRASTSRSQEPLGAQAPGAKILEQGLGRARQQTCPDGMGDSGERILISCQELLCR